jgi:putative glutamine amidotransferase
MSETLPLIGITVGAGKHNESNGAGLSIRSTYPRAVEIAGGAPVMIPLRIDRRALRSIYDRLDGLIISGGGDIAPARYGEKLSPYSVGIDPDRDEIEMQIITWAVEDDRPLLGICRGHQALNVALGGTLIQDIWKEVPGSLRHESPSDEWFTRTPHEVRVAPGSRLYRALGMTTDRIAVNSMHHQAVGQIAPDLCTVAQADDGVVEGLEHPDRRFVVSVQWHPEALAEREAPQRSLFEALVQAASR